jgi:hypothetical protein
MAFYLLSVRWIYSTVTDLSKADANPSVQNGNRKHPQQHSAEGQIKFPPSRLADVQIDHPCEKWNARRHYSYQSRIERREVPQYSHEHQRGKDKNNRLNKSLLW